MRWRSERSGGVMAGAVNERDFARDGGKGAQAQLIRLRQ
jgi:hypothetical protein